MSLSMNDEWLVLDAIDKKGPQTREEIETMIVMAIHQQCGLTKQLFHTVFSLQPKHFDYLLNVTLAQCIQLLEGAYKLTDSGRRSLHEMRTAHGPKPHKRVDSLWRLMWGPITVQWRKPEPVAPSTIDPPGGSSSKPTDRLDPNTASSLPPDSPT